jgi:hypothetical protein
VAEDSLRVLGDRGLMLVMLWLDNCGSCDVKPSRFFFFGWKGSNARRGYYKIMCLGEQPFFLCNQNIIKMKKGAPLFFEWS